MTGLDPDLRDLLAALRDLDERHRALGDREHSMAFAYAGGVLRSVLEHGVAPRLATEVLKAWAPTRALDRAVAEREDAALAEIARRDGPLADHELRTGRTAPLADVIKELEQ